MTDTALRNRGQLGQTNSSLHARVTRLHKYLKHASIVVSAQRVCQSRSFYERVSAGTVKEQEL